MISKDYALLRWVRDEGSAPVYQIVRRGIKAVLIAATLAQKLQRKERP